MILFSYYIIILNIIGLFICLIDKYQARHNGWRISEKMLIIVSFLGGCFGFYIGMLVFHHKTKKIKFKIVVPVFVVIWIIIIIEMILHC